MLTFKDPDQINLRDGHDSLEVNQLEIYLSKCRNETSPIPCASEQEIDSKINEHSIFLRSLTNFIDYEEVEPGVGPVGRIPFTVELMHTDKLDLLYFQEHVFSFIEHQIQLEDSLWQIMT